MKRRQLSRSESNRSFKVNPSAKNFHVPPMRGGYRL